MAGSGDTPWKGQPGVNEPPGKVLGIEGNLGWGHLTGLITITEKGGRYSPEMKTGDLFQVTDQLVG